MSHQLALDPSASHLHKAVTENEAINHPKKFIHLKTICKIICMFKLHVTFFVQNGGHPGPPGPLVCITFWTKLK